MAQAFFEQDIFIAVSPTIVRKFLETLNEHTKIHPLIIRIQQMESTNAADGLKVDHYRVRDRMKQGPFTLQFTYRVDMSIHTNGEIISDAYQSPGIHLHNVTSCEEENDGTLLRERVEITAPYLLIKTVQQQGLQSHKEMFVRLKQLLEQQHISS